MATNNPSGFTTVGPVLRATVYEKATNLAIFPGDMCQMNTLLRAGKVTVAVAGNTNLIGVAAGYVAATGTSVLVMDDPDQEYYVQLRGTTATAQSDVGKNIDLLATAGNTTFLKSKQRAGSGAITFAAAQLRVIDLHPSDGATASGRVKVVINEHHYAKKLGGVNP